MPAVHDDDAMADERGVSGAPQHRRDGSTTTQRASRRLCFALAGPREWRTLAVAAGVYGGWALAVVGHRALPTWAVVTLLAWSVAWHVSLQHETIHGHPFRDARVGHALGWPPLTLWLPYEAYRASHLAHHAADLTDPVDDPESYYVDATAFAERGALGRAVAVANRTLAFRLLVWSVLGIATFLAAGLRDVVTGRRPGARRTWAAHTVGAASVLTVAVGVAGVPLWEYLLGAVYGARVLNLVRSFAEHRWVPGDAPRSAMVDAGPLMRLLMLNLNLHLVHHESPGIAWYDLPAESRRTDAARRAAAGAGHYPGGYAEIARRYAFRPFCQAPHPAAGPAAGGGRRGRTPGRSSGRTTHAAA
jgi:fatty acid desaturase